MATERVRLDKWLWAARFFKTRSQARSAIEGGKVHVAGQRCKAGRDVRCGEQVEIRKGPEVWEVTVTGLSEQRRGAPEARLLYEETEAGRERREHDAARRKAARAMLEPSVRRPDKKQRRQIIRFRQQDS